MGKLPLVCSLSNTVRSREQRCDVTDGHVLQESGVPLAHVCFPTTAIVSLLCVMENGDSAEIAIVGHEGGVGTSVFLGAESTPSRAIVQSAGEGFRLKAQTMRDEFQHPAVRQLLLRYTQALVTQMSQTAVCNRHHSVDQQLCRWLLLSLDGLQGMELVMTQELIANMLGVRREGVTESAQELQSAGLIRDAKGHILVLDRSRRSRFTPRTRRVVTLGELSALATRQRSLAAIAIARIKGREAVNAPV